MTLRNPENCDYLAIVSEWSSTTRQGGVVGNAYPILNLAFGEAVAAAQEEFPNPGAVFLMNRGSLKTWDFISLRPRQNERYKDASERDCYFIPARQPELITSPSQLERVAVILDAPSFDLEGTARQILTPRHNVTPYFFVQKNQTIYGPLVRVLTQLSPMEDIQRIDWRPAGEDGVVYEFSRDELLSRGLRLVRYSHPNSQLNRVLAVPIQLAFGNIRRATSDKPHDALPAGVVIEWYLQRCPGVEVTPALLSALKAAFRGDPSDDPAITAARLRTIESELATSAAFLEHRDRFAKHYVESEAGRRRVQELLEQAVTKKELEIQAEVDRRQSRLAARRDELAQRLAEAERDHQKKVQELQVRRQALDQEIDGLQAAAKQLRGSLVSDAAALAVKMREQIPLFAALAATRGPVAESVPVVVNASAAATLPTPPRRLEFRPVPPETSTAPVTDESKLVDDLHADFSRRGLHFARDFVANAYTCLKAEALNLIIGPPGFGKSMLVATLARALGHGDALLRIPVRRSWAEDRHLIGFFDSFHGRYDPGATGLVTRLLQAEADWKTDQAGIYIVLLDEFNLAAPEYYFSQLLQALPSDDPTRELMLYDPASSGGDGFPSRVLLTPNLRFWGTINYDETTERLSPRTLDRTGMIFLGDADLKPTIDDDLPAMPAVAASDVFDKYLRTADDCPEEQWALVSKVIDLLRRPDAGLGPRVELSPRVRQGIKRYLANSARVLDPRVAVDFVIQQRILPVVRGRGDEFLARISSLAELLAAESLTRSALHIEEALRRSGQQFGELDFLTY